MIENKIKKINNNSIVESMNFEDMITSWLRSLDLKESTKKTYRRKLRPFFRWLESKNKLNANYTLKKEDIIQFKQELLEEEKSIYTINGYLTTVRRFFEWLSENNSNIDNITRGIRNFKKPEGHSRDDLTVKQVKECLNSIDTTTITGKRDYALFNLLARTGLRSIEVKNAKVKDIRQKQGRAVLYIQGKGRDSKDQYVVLNEKSYKPIREYLMLREQQEDDYLEEDYIFISHSSNRAKKELATRSIRRIIKKIFKGVGLNTKRYTTHSLRHTAITQAIKGKASLRQVQLFARHKDPKTTANYIHDLNRIDNPAEDFINY